ncbi:hypothetical protein NIES37_15680 [Tolypothrix tenuis PCC 7101]|uniref:Uncharacterized protein n=1 Tax=Tolypothrix tenuis PCC 7101 TaxID=231146 RepID=A0A1Z4MVX9_9CYAN|nr:hypothetical protein [Aulosira sp. FACHB-113]BAY97624.1 hypothetical protein NIES37_15680 [Tolypothrix tenuis PCC 7101]BAZ71868.1 hypothetical protein NIES50_04150 [Aulosira laxa NIES-50]
MSTFLSGVAVFLSTVALLCGGYAAYEVFTLRQTLNTTSTSTQTNTASPISTKQSVPPEPETTASPSPETTPSPAATSANAIQPGQFVQPAFGNKAEVEILSAKRIKDPETANRDVINLQMRIRRQATDGVGGSDIISIANTTARNPDTSETYKGVSANRSTGTVSLAQLRPKASADAYVWIRVPDGVKNVDLFVPDTAAFKNVPISN